MKCAHLKCNSFSLVNANTHVTPTKNITYVSPHASSPSVPLPLVPGSSHVFCVTVGQVHSVQFAINVSPVV